MAATDPQRQLLTLIREFASEKSQGEPDRQAVKKVVTEVELRALEDILAHVASQTTKQEQEYIVEENIQNQVQQDHIDLQRKFSLMENSERNKSIAGLNKTSELEQHYASLAEQLQKRCMSPLLCR